ncbi:hypothetical protein APHAL10511_000895 [Amanita phalloides]|nr:hypothetical protein APHAL10511_000895 [Amanita phalloides]
MPAFALAHIPVGCCQYPGQGPRKVEEEIRLLDPSLASRRQGDSKGQMGGGHRDLGAEPLGSNAETKSRSEASQGVDAYPSLFFHDPHANGWTPVGTYIRSSELVLGDADDIDVPLQSKNQPNGCFNCGSLDHHVGACPLPHDRSRILLSRQYYNFFKDDDTVRYERLIDATEWQRQRLEWVNEFEPGIIKSRLLQLALGDEDIYLKKIALWGYPKGWFSVRDPRELVKEHILNCSSFHLHDTEPFFIFGDQVESLPSVTPASAKRHPSSEPVAEPKRWATYPPTYFKTDILPVYIPNLQSQAQVPLTQGGRSSSYTPDRQHLWETILFGRIPLGDSCIPPWRLSDAFSESSSSNPSQIDGSLPAPPPPTESPPPLPSASPQSVTEMISGTGLIMQVRPVLPSVSPYGLLFSGPPDVCLPYLGMIPSEESDMEISDME